MEDVVKKGTAASYINLGSMPVAGKTGTTTDSKDLWFVGYTPYYTAGIWGGYDNNNGDQASVNTSYHKRIWNIIMNKIHKDSKKKSFVKPDSIITKTICTKSGKLAQEGVCDQAPGGSTVRKEYFARGTQPTETCDVHVKLNICKSSDLQAGEFCPDNTVEEKVYLIKDETGSTKDTPYLLPKKLEDSSCDVHTHAEIIQPPDEDEDYEDESEEEDDEVLPPIPDVPIPDDSTPPSNVDEPGDQTSTPTTEGE